MRLFTIFRFYFILGDKIGVFSGFQTNTNEYSSIFRYSGNEWVNSKRLIKSFPCMKSHPISMQTEIFGGKKGEKYLVNGFHFPESRRIMVKVKCPLQSFEWFGFMAFKRGFPLGKYRARTDTLLTTTKTPSN